MNFEKIIVLIILLANNLFAQSGWIEKMSGTNENLNSVYFLNNTKAFIVGDSGTLLRTTDGGSSWQKLTSGTTNNLTKIIFIENKNGFILGSNKTYLISTDAGESWIDKSIQVTKELLCIDFYDLNHGIALSGSQNSIEIFKTVNGGETWEVQSSSPFNVLWSPPYIHYQDSNHVTLIISATGNTGVFRSSDGGDIWSYIWWSPESISTSGGFDDAIFLDSTTGFLIGRKGRTSSYSSYLFKTTNGGDNWQEISIPNHLPPQRSIYMVNNTIGYVVGANGFGNSPDSLQLSAAYITTDGGIQWHKQISNYPNKLNDVFFADSIKGIIVGNKGTILCTTTGGIVGVEERNTRLPNEFSLEQNYPNPFNPSTTISFILPKSTFITIKLFNTLGQELQTISSGNFSAGRHTVQFNNKDLASGIYLYKLSADDNLLVKKMMILK